MFIEPSLPATGWLFLLNLRQRGIEDRQHADRDVEDRIKRCKDAIQEVNDKIVSESCSKTGSTRFVFFIIQIHLVSL